MGNNEVTHRNSLNEVNYIFDLFRNMNWRERVFKTFCFRFEYKYYKNAAIDSSKVRYTIGWSEFEKEMLNNFKNLETNPAHYCIHNTFKKYFELQGSDEIRVFKIYMLYFPYILHLKETESLNFIDLIFEKIIYNLEVEMKKKLRSDQQLEDSFDSAKEEEVVKDKFEKQDDKSVSRRDMDLSDMRSNRNLLFRNEVGSLLDKNIEKPRRRALGDVSQVDNDLSMRVTYDNQLLRDFLEYYKTRGKNKSFTRTLPVGIFREIMYVYFQNNITLIIQAFKECLLEFKENDYENDSFIKKIKALKPGKINLDRFTSTNVYKFIDHTLEKLAKKRINIPKFKDFSNLELTFDDIYVYLKLNPYFLDSTQCYEEFTKIVYE